MRRRPDLTEKVKDAVVRDYLQGDKTIVIQMEYKISPGEMYRVLHSRHVSLRKAPEACLIVDDRQLLPSGNPFRVALWNLMLESYDWVWNDTFDKMAKVLVEHLEREPYSTVEALGFLNQAFKPEQLVDRAFEMLIEFTLSYSPDFEHLNDGSYRSRRGNDREF
ncbi:hypothetical protein ES703_114511 [subsurface metagenome]